MGKYRQEIILNKNLHFTNFDNEFGQWQLQLPPKFAVRQKDQNQFEPIFFFNKGMLQTFVYLEIRFMLFK